MLIVLLTALFTSVVNATPVPLGQVGDATACWEANAGLSGITLTCNGITFQPFAGGAGINPNGEADPSVVMQVYPKVKDGVLVIDIVSNDGPARGVDPGHVEGLGDWRRLDLTRQTEAYGQMWWQKTNYSVMGDFWFTAHWLMECSNATGWGTDLLDNAGTGPFPAALKTDYAPNTNGHHLNIRERMEIRVSRNLWDVVPLPRQMASEYATELADMVQLDLWGGVADPELMHLLQVMKLLGRDHTKFISLLQNWQVGGFDAMLPDSVWMPEYPPNPSIGTISQLQDLCDLGRQIGRFGFRTNYRVLRQNSPSFRKGLARFAVDSNNKSMDYLSPTCWPQIVGRQEAEIQELFASDASFTDQITSGAAPWAWHDYAADGTRSIKGTLKAMREMCSLIRTTQHGPLGSESLMDQELLGEFVDTGDYGIMDGYHRLISPEFKLRRLQHLSTFHGIGLFYRYFEMPPYPQFHTSTTTFNNDDVQLDDYRAGEILFGNGAYVCYPFANWRYWITETLLVGNLQKYYALQPVEKVLYQHNGQWLTLEELIEQGIVPQTSAFAPQSPELGQIRVEYANGLTIVVNRLSKPLEVPDAKPQGITLCKSGWVAWMADGTVTAFSADWPETFHRVDYLRDDRRQIEFLDPRGEKIRGTRNLTYWEHGKLVIEANAGVTELTVDGVKVPLELPQPEPREELTSQFDNSLEGWHIGDGILTGAVGDSALVLHTVTPDPQLYLSNLKLDGSKISALEVRMKISAGDLAQLYFSTENSASFIEDRCFRVPLIADNEWHTYRIDTASHPQWKDNIITGLRFDPVHGPAESTIEIDSFLGLDSN